MTALAEASSCDSGISLSELLRQVKSERPDWLGRLLDRYRNYLTILARAQVREQLQARVDASDVVQETMLDAVRDFGRFRGQSEHEFVAWLRQILSHNLQRFVELHVQAGKRDVRCEVSIDQLTARIDRSTAGLNRMITDQSDSPSLQARKRETATLVADLLTQLPDHYREVIVLRNMQGLPFEQVATEMQRSAGAVRMLWVRAIDRFRLLLEQTRSTTIDNSDRRNA